MRFPTLCFVISFLPDFLVNPNKTKSQKKSAIESWAIMVLFALRNVPNAGKKPSETVTFVRPYVLGSLAQANQDAVVSEEPFDARYGASNNEKTSDPIGGVAPAVETERVSSERKGSKG
ncbi:hypothetical protein BY996DRAFT_6420598 [Phakopsora pachyrhizi]|nr:hypothetical protein BY996DRAFT_6420598 [Phakopsora pachyrhizi]